MAPRVADAKRKGWQTGSENATAPPSRPAGFGVLANLPLLPKDRSSHQIFNTSHGQKTLETAAERRPGQKAPIITGLWCVCVCALHAQNRNDAEPPLPHYGRTLQKGGIVPGGPGRAAAASALKKGKVGEKKKNITNSSPSLGQRSLEKKHNTTLKQLRL